MFKTHCVTFILLLAASRLFGQQQEKPRFVYDYGSQIFTSSSITPDNRLLILEGDNSIRIYNTNFGLPVNTLSNKSELGSSLKISRDGNYFSYNWKATGSKPYSYDSVLVVSTKTGSVVVSAGRRAALFPLPNGMLSSWDKELDQLKFGPIEGPPIIRTACTEYYESEDQQLLCVRPQFYSDSLKIINVKTHEMKNILLGPGFTLQEKPPYVKYNLMEFRFSKHGRYLAFSALLQKTKRIYWRVVDVTTGQTALEIQLDTVKKNTPYFEHQLIINDSLGEVYILDNGKLITYNLESHRKTNTLFPEFRGIYIKTELSQDGRYLIFCGDQLCFYDTKTHTWGTNLGYYSDLLLNSPRNLLYIENRGFNDSVRVYNLEQHQFEGVRPGSVQSVSPDGSLVYAKIAGVNGLYNDHLQLIQDLNNGVDIYNMEAHGDYLEISFYNAGLDQELTEEFFKKKQIWRISDFEQANVIPYDAWDFWPTGKDLVYRTDDQAYSVNGTLQNCDTCGKLFDGSSGNLLYWQTATNSVQPFKGTLSYLINGNQTLQLKVSDSLVDGAIDTLHRNIYGLGARTSTGKAIIYKWNERGEKLSEVTINSCPDLSKSRRKKIVLEDHGRVAALIEWGIFGIGKVVKYHYYNTETGQLLDSSFNGELIRFDIGANRKIKRPENRAHLTSDSIRISDLQGNLLFDFNIRFYELRDSILAGYWAADTVKDYYDSKKGSVRLYNWINNTIIYQDTLPKDTRPYSISFTDKSLAYIKENDIVTIQDYRAHSQPVLLSGHEGRIKDLVISPDNLSLISSSEDGSLRKWTLTGQEIARVFFYDTQNYLTMIPEGYYWCPKSIIGRFAYHFRNQLYPLAQFDLLFNRPDTIMSKLSSRDQLKHDLLYSSWKKRLESNHISDPQSVLFCGGPEITLLNEAEYRKVSDSEHFRLAYQINDSIGSPVNVRFRINGSLVAQKELRLGIINKLYSVSDSLSLELNSGENRIEVSALNTKGITSPTRILNIYCSAKPVHPPHYYFVGLGVKNYQEPGKSLDYPIKDIEAVNAMFKHRYKDSLTSYIFPDAQVNQHALDSLKKLLALVQKEDMVIIMLNGHGLLSDSLEFYFATIQTHFDKPDSNSLSYRQIEELLKHSAARKKVLLIDACYSGLVDQTGRIDIEKKLAADPVNGVRVALEAARRSRGKIKDKNSFQYMQDLFADLADNDGAVVISAARGLENASEGKEWGHSIFSYCLLKALETARPGKLSISGLIDQLNQTIPKASKGRQNASVRQINQVYDWAIW